MTTDPLADGRITAIGLFGEAYSGLIARLSAQVAGHHLTQAEFEVLIRLARSPHGTLRMTDLAKQTGMTGGGVTRMVDRLERDGLVRRAACPHDRRTCHAEITDAGRDRVTAILPGHLALVDEWLVGRLTPEQLDGLLVALRLIRDAVHPGATAGAEPSCPPPGRPAENSLPAGDGSG